MRSREWFLAGSLGLSLAACAADEGGLGASRQVTRDTVGDTIIVRTETGTVWGEAQLVERVRIGQFDGPAEYTFGRVLAIATRSDGTLYVLDQEPPSLRAYSPDGAFLRQVAGEGEGPGELKTPDSGLAILPDGRLLVRDPAAARISVFGADDEYETEWRIRGAIYTNTPLYTDTAGSAYVQLLQFLPQGPRFSFVRYGPDGHPTDTLEVPRVEGTPQLRAESEGNVSVAGIPFWPDLSTTLSLDGRMVVGHPDAYSIDIPREGGVLRIQRAAEPVRVLDAERDNRRQRVTYGMRQIEPGWKWNGPPIPDTKPVFRNIMLDMDGRLWASIHSQAEPIPDDEIEHPAPGEGAPPALRWREPTRLDVFAVEGAYLGQLTTPPGFELNPRPAITGDSVWAVVMGEFEVPYLVRFQIITERDRP